MRIQLPLLGQYNLTESLKGDIRDLYKSVIGEMEDFRMEFKDGYLWVELEPKKPLSVPLLASTEKLLRKLQLALPGKTEIEPIDEEDKEVVEEPNAQDDMKEMGMQEVQENGEQQSYDDPMDVDGEANEDSKEDTMEGDTQVDKEKDSEQNGDAESTKKKEPAIRPEDLPYQSLQRSTDLSNVILTALNDIRCLKQRDYNKDKVAWRDKNAEARKKEALELQRKRLQQQLSGSSELSEEDLEESGEDPWVRLVRTLNSLTALTPVLLDMLMHEKRDDKKLVIGTVKLTAKNRNRNTPCWLLGCKVYDTTTTRMAKSLYNQLIELWILFGITKEQVTKESDPWRETTGKTMQSILSQKTTSSDILPHWIGAHPYDGLTVSERQILDELTLKLDEQCGLVESKDAKEHGQYLKAVEKLHARVSNLLKKRFRGARLSMYGSCLSDLSLGKSSDVDLSLHLKHVQHAKESFEGGHWTVNRYQSEMKKTVYQVCRKLEYEKSEFRDMQPVTRARVPVVKGTFLPANNPHEEDGSLNFDICFLNDIAVANSSLIREYSLVDPRVRHLMIAVKRWATDRGISSAQDNTLSSYTWMNLVIFYLQCLGFVPNLQSSDLMAKVGVAADDIEDYWRSVNNLDTYYLTWEEASDVWNQPKSLQSKSVTSLLYGFFHFYACDFPTPLYMISIKRGRESILPKTLFRKCSLFLCVEDPFETYDSHCPHDLGTPANEPGMKQIMQAFQEGEQYLRKAILGLLEDPSALSACTALWMKPIENKTEGLKQKAEGPGKNKKQEQKPNKAAEKKTSGSKQNANPGKKNQEKQKKQEKGQPKKKTQADGRKEGSVKDGTGVSAASSAKTESVASKTKGKGEKKKSDDNKKSKVHSEEKKPIGDGQPQKGEAVQANQEPAKSEQTVHVPDGSANITQPSTEKASVENKSGASQSSPQKKPQRKRNKKKTPRASNNPETPGSSKTKSETGKGLDGKAETAETSNGSQPKADIQSASPGSIDGQQNGSPSKKKSRKRNKKKGDGPKPSQAEGNPPAQAEQNWAASHLL